MKHLHALALALCVVSSASAQTSVGVSIGINQPGVYGEIHFGDYPPPRVINRQPILIMQSPVREPLYLYVPAGHQKRWKRYCSEYDACGRPVYFVRETWVRERYEEHRRGEDHDGRGNDHEKRRKHKHKDD